MTNEQLARFYQALACPTRILMVRHLLHCGECRMIDLVCQTDLEQSSVSSHAKILRQAGIVAYRRIGIEHYYYVCNPSLMTHLLTEVSAC